MDSTAISWLSEMGFDNPNFTGEFDEELAAMLGQDFDACFSAEESLSPSSALINVPSCNSITSMINSPPENISEPRQKMQKTNNYSDFSMHPDGTVTSTPIFLNFGNANSPEKPEQPSNRSLGVGEEVVASEIFKSQDSKDRSKPVQNEKKTSRVRPPSQTYDHIIAERKRREQLSQHFLTLSTIVPDLKKTDKTSVLGDAIKYLQYLKERLKVLEEKTTKKVMESVVFVKKSQIMVEGEDSSDEKTPNEKPLPEIEAKICGNQILIRIQCDKQKGILVKLISKVEKLHLSIVSSSITAFGNMALDITIVAEMEKGFNLTITEMVIKLRVAVQPIP